MLTPTELLEVVDTMQPIVDELNDWITRDIIRRLMARLERDEDFTLTGTDEWQVEVFKAAGGHYEALQQEIKRFTKKSDKEVKEIFEDIGVRAWESDMDFYANYGFESVSLFESESMLKLLEDTYRRTNGEIHNFTRTTAEASQQRLIKALDSAHFKVMSGAQSYTQAVKEAVNEIANTQATIHYPSGHVDTIETAVLRAVRTGAGQASGNMTMQGLIDRDWDLIRVSAHLGARYGDGGQNPSNHFWWQGKLYSRTGRTEEYPLFEEATGYGTGEGLCGYNCRHSFGPGDPNHNPYQDFDAEENKKVYDLYQKQRRAESRIRKSKSKLIALREAMDCSENEEVKASIQEEYNKEALKLSKHNAEYNKFCEDNGLKRLQDRISVAKWNRSEAAKARNAVNTTDSVDKSSKSDIIKTESGMMLRKSRNNKVEPMPKKQFQRIEKAFKRHGGVFQYGKETDVYLDSKNAEAITYNATTILFKRNPSRASVFEELIHATQYRTGRNDGSYESRLLCEIEAQEKLLRCKNVYKLTDIEVNQTEQALHDYKEELANYRKGGISYV